MFSCLWPCVATFFVGLAVGAAGMWVYFMLDALRAHRRGTMAELGCYMVLIETADFKEFWECSCCLIKHKAGVVFEKSTTCPSCGRKITRWVGVDDDVHDEC